MFHVEHRTTQENDRKQNTMRSIMRRTAVAIATLTLPAFLVACQGSDRAASATPSHRPTATVTPAILAGDDNRDGIIREEESGFNCRTMGNKRCDKRPPLVQAVCVAKDIEDSATGRPVRLNKVPPKLIPACAKLAGKPGRWTKYQGAWVYVAPGTARVIECREQYTGLEGYGYDELRGCLNQK